MRKLTIKKVREIYVSDKKKTTLAKEYGVSLDMIYGIKSHRYHRRYTANLIKPEYGKPRAKPLLDDKTVESIYTSKGKVIDIAKKFNTNTSTVYKIKQGVSYTKITNKLN